jgi:serine/threonine protein kinase
MWSLGCITVVLLTGGSPFMSPKTNLYCHKLAQQCDLQQLEKLPEWRSAGKRPKDFVRRLLVLNEKHRMSAHDAKRHPWFSNDAHRVDFEAVYDRSVKHWRPRAHKSPIIEMIDAEQLKALPMMQGKSLPGQRKCRDGKPLTPIDPPYKPYPRKMSHSLLPQRRPSATIGMSDEVTEAIQQNWSPERMEGQLSTHATSKMPVPVLETATLNQQLSKQVNQKREKFQRPSRQSTLRLLGQKRMGPKMPCISNARKRKRLSIYELEPDEGPAVE